MAGQLRVDEITDEAGTGAPSFPNGIPPASLGTGTPSSANFLRGDGQWQGVPANPIEILNTQTFDSSGTWTKPAGFSADDTVVVVCIGGGGGGGALYANTSNTASANGGTGAVAIVGIRYDSAPASTSVVVGSGGAGGVSSTLGTSSPGANGGYSFFGTDQNNCFVSAQGRAGAAGFVGIGYGVTTTTLGVGATTPGTTNYASGLRNPNGTNDTLPGLVGSGGTIQYLTSFVTGGKDGIKGTLFGEGGNAGQDVNGENGGFPGGGGGASRRLSAPATAGNGGAGRVIVYICKGRVYPANIIPVAGS